jgi:hypothetical protein
VPDTNRSTVDQRASVERVGDIEVQPRQGGGYAVTITLNVALRTPTG